MNAKFLLDQLMKQAGGGSSSSGSSRGGFDVQGLINSVSSQLSGGSSSRGGMDMKSLLGGGALGMLMGSKRGRSMGGKAIKYGAIAGVGMLAWKAWQASRSGSTDATHAASAQEGAPLEELNGAAQEQRSLEVLQAVIMAARADGHIDAEERALISEQMQQLGADDELHAWVEQQLTAPLDAEALARQADSPQAAREMYLASAAVIDEQNAMERAWLEELGTALGLDESMRRELERQLESLN
ncbi:MULTISPECIES: tellurite resistance TerB family protein [Halomonas]|uniref:tellurite resistance TerB family protein n=1 Tax=Halomonas TaxID=2745 RepID=UPI001C977EDA|nr:MULTISPECIES: tellurite resistance TerB family protein [Halomonas]MBY5969268.1 tellurite resistance TerB family protein [Halomonas denitrificans]MBY6030585.1 tellurite resistance TerB family protein [Halomonas sp. DP8Y7-1]MBY6207947.1 tellurite resistance TerB family protein [Halomonas sp. DP3Y7-2]MBY6228756.1 tellurite resistance TerB family protein [Halomonas sp. DP3Y7-1]MCA0917260.1 tellurite resistance TerB family protein [Halomonas denitrificans]